MAWLDLPKGYLSHSQIELWLRSKADYRKRYYEGRGFYITPEIEFGKMIAEQVEAMHKNEPVPLAHPILADLPRGTHSEYELRCELRGVPVLGFIDSFDDGDLTIHEYKSGKKPWTQGRTDRHPQLKMYAASIRTLRGEYNPYAQLHWLETENYEDEDMIDGVGVSTRRIRLTGKLTTFKTTIHINDIIEYENLVERVARDISTDYTLWKRLHPPVEEMIDGVTFTS